MRQLQASGLCQGCSSGAAGLRSPHLSINTSLSNGSKKQMKLARRTSPCVACGAPIVVDTPIAPLLGQNGRIRLCINQLVRRVRIRHRHAIEEVDATIQHAQVYGGCTRPVRRRRRSRARTGRAAACATSATAALSRIRLWLTCLAVWKSKFYGAFEPNHRVVLHAISATPARWRGDAGSSPLDRARTAANTRLTG